MPIEKMSRNSVTYFKGKFLLLRIPLILVFVLNSILILAQGGKEKANQIFSEPFFNQKNNPSPNSSPGALKSSVLIQDSAEKLQLIHANKTGKSPEKYNGNLYLTGNVEFFHKGSTLKADVVIWHQNENYVEAIGKARLSNPDGSTITSEEMQYNSNTQIGIASKNVVLKDPKQTIRTEKLFYERLANKAYFNTGGTISDASNTMYTQNATYDLTNKQINFDGNVSINSKDYTIDGKNIIQDQISNTAYFSGPTFIRNKKNPSNYVYTESGKYEMNSKMAYLNKNSRIHYNNKILRGKEMTYSQLSGYGKAIGNVELHDPQEKRLIRGNYGEIFEKKDSAVIWDKAYAVKAMERDSAYFGAEKIIAWQKLLPSNPGKKSFLRAYRQARFFKSNAQARADSLSFNETDGILHLTGKPILWNGPRQASGNDLKAYINTETEQIDSLHIIGNGFVIAKADSLSMNNEFNQIKGREIRVYFQNNEMQKANVLGNAQSIVFVDENTSENSSSENQQNTLRFGLAKSTCGIIQALFEARTVQIIECSIGANTNVFPMSRVTEEVKFFPDFNWNTTDRLKIWQDIFKDSPKYDPIIYETANPYREAFDKKNEAEKSKNQPKSLRKERKL